MGHRYEMDTVTIRELRQHWPQVERRLKAAPEGLLITRDGVPVARLEPPPTGIGGPEVTFSAAAHRQWRVQRWNSKAPRTNSAGWLAKAREDDRRGQQP
jgi:antitoxin (DNA-binding transcriptional repressor) of toxin-antitoxin stability system